jgi:mono/diheme cytochrome c family protein
MKSIAIAVLVCAGTAATAAAQDAKVARGEELYAAQKCGLCHSIGDKGNKKGPLDGVGARLSSDELRQWLVDARGMTAKTGAPRKPEITTLDAYPLNVNDRDASLRLADAFRKYFGPERVRETGPAPASEDFGSFGTDWHAPSVFWFVGGTDPQLYAQAKAANRLNELPVNHSPKFAPVLHPTLQTGVETLLVAARTWMPAQAG